MLKNLRAIRKAQSMTQKELAERVAAEAAAAAAKEVDE